jgi:hypothetical protein
MLKRDEGMGGVGITTYKTIGCVMENNTVLQLSKWMNETDLKIKNIKLSMNGTLVDHTVIFQTNGTKKGSF